MSAIKSTTTTTSSATAVAKQTSPFFRLPGELRTRCFTFLCGKDLLASKRVCRDWEVSYTDWQVQAEKIDAETQEKYFKIWDGAQSSEKLTEKEWEQFLTLGPVTRKLDLSKFSLGKLKDLFDFTKYPLFADLSHLKVDLRTGRLTSRMSMELFNKERDECVSLAKRIPFHCPSLTSLHTGMQFLPVGEVLLPPLKGLRKLTLMSTYIRESPGQQVADGLQQLMRFCPPKCTFTIEGEGVKSLAQIPRLSNVCVLHTETDGDLEAFVKAHSRADVTDCIIVGNPRFTNKGMSHLREMSGLQNLRIYLTDSKSSITDLSATHGLKRLQRVEILSADSGVLPSLLKSAPPGLPEIVIDRCTSTSEALPLLSQFPCLSKLTINHPYLFGAAKTLPITDKDFLQVARCKRLSSLTLGAVGQSSGWEITQTGIIKTCQQCPSLKELHFTGNRKHFDEAVNFEAVEKALSANRIQVYFREVRD